MASRVITTAYDNIWYDSLDGNRLREGDQLDIHWVNGDVQRIEVKTRVVTVGTLVGGQSVEVPYHKAYFLLPPRAQFDIHLNGFRAQRA